MATDKERVTAGDSESITKLNLRIVELVRQLDALDLIEIFSGRASSLLRASDNQNQNQNGSRQPRALKAE
jgi:hypothetical protein